MELKKLTEKILELFGCQKIGELPEKVYNAVLSGNKGYFERYLALVDGDLTADYLQKVFQYYLADRKEKCQDFTPASIAKLLAALTGDADTVYDCCAGSGALSIQKWQDNKDAMFICEELDCRVVPFLLFNLGVRNVTGYVINRNVLTLETEKIYKLTGGETFSTVEIVDDVPEIMADAAISNPPYNIKWDSPAPLTADERFQVCDIPPASNANYAFVLTALNRLKPDGKCAFVLPCGVLSQSNEKSIRQYLVDSGRLETVIVLPDRMFEATTIPTCVLLFGENGGAVRMYDCRKRCETGIREQNGQYGGASHEGRTYKKEIRILPDELINLIASGAAEDEAEFCRVVPIDEIAENDYLLVLSRYIEFQEQEQTHRPHGDIIDDINHICRERNVIKITVNETLAKAMGLDELYRLAQESNASIEEMKKTFALFDKEPVKSDYISLSKNKNELKIENRDKELLSSLLSIFMPMWRQHLYYLNQEENRYLIELRDALLPDLMSGKITL